MKKAAIIFVILFVLTLAVPAAASAAKSSGGTNELVTIEAYYQENIIKINIKSV